MEYKTYKRGAPKGGRVHWLLWNLPTEFKRAYKLYYNYKKHNYVFMRYKYKNLIDVFIIKQSSQHWWRVMYAHPEKQVYEYFGFRSTRIIAEIMFELYKSNS